MARLQVGKDDTCVCKRLLEYLDDGPKKGLDTYRSYIGKSLNLNLSHSNLANMEDSLLAKFYVHKSPLVSPKYFSFWRSRDLALLEEALDVRMVIVRRGPHERWSKIHDRRIYDILAGEDRHERKEFFLS